LHATTAGRFPHLEIHINGTGHQNGDTKGFSLLGKIAGGQALPCETKKVVLPPSNYPRLVGKSEKSRYARTISVFLEVMARDASWTAAE